MVLILLMDAMYVPCICQGMDFCDAVSEHGMVQLKWLQQQASLLLSDLSYNIRLEEKEHMLRTKS